jgi:hypothetical protein
MRLGPTIFATLTTLAIITVGALLGGTLVYWLWPIAVPVAFPGLVANGTLAASLPWWPSVCLTWLLILLLKPAQTSSKS